MTEPHKKAKQAKQERLELAGKLYKKGYSYRMIKKEVMEKLSLKTYSLGTIERDIKQLLTEWRNARIEDIDHVMQLELERIDECIRELWDQWEKSKTDHNLKSQKEKGNKKKGETTISEIERSVKEEICLGDPRYIAEIRAQLVERRKLLGLYAPEKREVTGKDGEQLLKGFDTFMDACFNLTKENIDGQSDQ